MDIFKLICENKIKEMKNIVYSKGKKKSVCPIFFHKDDKENKDDTKKDAI